VRNNRNHGSHLQELTSTYRAICDVGLCPARVTQSVGSYKELGDACLCSPSSFGKNRPHNKIHMKSCLGVCKSFLEGMLQLHLDGFIFKNTILVVKQILNRVQMFKAD